MPVPVILVDGAQPPPLGTKANGTKALSATPALSLQTSIGIDSVAWSIVSKPAAATTSIANASPASPFSTSLTAMDAVGTYILRCTATTAGVAYYADVALAVMTSQKGLRVPASPTVEGALWDATRRQEPDLLAMATALDTPSVTPITATNGLTWTNAQTDVDQVTITGGTGVTSMTIGTPSVGRRVRISNQSPYDCYLNIGATTLLLSHTAPNNSIEVWWDGAAFHFIGGTVVFTIVVVGNATLTTAQTDVDEIKLTGTPGATFTTTLATPSPGRKILVSNQSNATQTINIGANINIPATRAVVISHDGAAWQALGPPDIYFQGNGGTNAQIIAGDGSIQNLVPYAAQRSSTIKVAVGTAATATSAATIPAGAIVTRCRLQIGTSYSAAATVSVGYAGALTAFMTTAQSNPQDTAGNIYGVDQMTTVASVQAVVATVGGAPAAGAATVLVDWVIPST